MKQFKIVQAYKEMETLANNSNISDEMQWELFKLRKLMRPHVDFHAERENALKAKYAKDADQDGNIYGEALQSYVKEFNDLNNMDVEMEEFTKPIIPHNGINFISMEKLEDFIEFT